MIGLLLLLAAAHAAADPAMAPGLGCSLSTPRGEAVSFRLNRNGAASIVAAPQADTVWPANRLTGSPARGLKPGFLAPRAYAFGDGAEGPVLHLGTPSRDSRWQPATVYWRSGRQLVRPVAFGYCVPAAENEPAPIAPAPLARGPAAPFDAARSDQASCTLTTIGGRRFSLDYEFELGSKLRMKAPGIWADPGVTVVRQERDTRPGQPMVAFFGVREGPAGTEMSFIDEKNMVGSRLVQFQRLASTNKAMEDVGFAICGYQVAIGEVMVR